MNGEDAGAPSGGGTLPGGEPQASEGWSPHGVRGLRAHLGLSQEQLARRIGTRQQTISEWETGARRPRRMSQRLLRMVAEESGYYATGGEPPAAAPDEGAT